MSPLLSVAAASAAAILAYRRRRRLADRLPLPRIARAKSRALAEGLVVALTVLFIGWLLAPALAPAPLALHPVFIIVALCAASLQFRQTWRMRRTRGA
ncbi:hypothetical protein O4H52_16070 [Sphingomonadaceae bacterium G21617-S1]|jgi:hypothetical protein|nr:hypothetical protein [Sphingomonadaceae bacterium G21617-S1]